MLYSGQILRLNDLQYTQVNKTTARKLYEAKQPILLHSSNMAFNNPWQSPFPYDKDHYDTTTFNDKVFDNIVNSFEYYNCDSERGLYTHFFQQIFQHTMKK